MSREIILCKCLAMNIEKTENIRQDIPLLFGIYDQTDIFGIRTDTKK